MGGRAATIGLLGFILFACGPGAEAELARLTDPDPAVRRVAALALASAGDRQDVLTALGGALEDDDEGVRDAAAASLFRIDPRNLRRVVDGAGEALGASFAEVLPDAVEAAYDADDLGMLSALPRAMVLLAPHGEEALRDLLTHDQDLVRSWAAAGLATQPTLSDSTVKLLEEALYDDEEIVRLSAMQALETVGPRAAGSLDRIIGLLAGPGSASIHELAADLLGAIGPGAAKGVPALVARLSDEEYSVRFSAAEALAAVGETAVPALVDALSSESGEVRGHAAYALVEMGEAAAPAAEVLTRLAGDPAIDEEFRGRCLLALGAIGPAAAVATDTLIGILEAPRPAREGEDARRNRAHAATVLGLLGPSAGKALPALQIAMESADEGLVLAAAKAVHSVSGEFESTARALAGVIASTDLEWVSERAAEAIAGMGPDAAALIAPELTLLLAGGGRPAELSIARLLRDGLREPPGVLVALLDDEKASSRIAATLALSRIRPDGLERLIGELKSGDAEARETAAFALELLRRDAVAAIPALFEILIDPEEDVRRAAARAIAAIDPVRAAKSREIERIRFGGSITEDDLRRIARTIWETR